MSAKRIAILYPGEMGTAIGGALREAGHEIVANVRDRGPQTQANARAAAFNLADDLTTALAKADLVISVVPPGEAVHTAKRIAASLAGRARTPGNPIFLDLNSIAPSSMQMVGDVAAAAGLTCVDGTIVGPAKLLREECVMMLSGPKADILRKMFSAILPVRILGDQIGTASAFKMCWGAFNKGLTALFLESIVAAGHIGQESQFIDCLSKLYPGTAQLVARLLPSYPKHVARRLQEVGEVQSWLAGIGVAHGMADGTFGVLEDLQNAALDPSRSWQFEEFVAALLQSDSFGKSQT